MRVGGEGQPLHAALRAATVVGFALALVTCILPNDPAGGRSAIAFKVTPETLVVALRDSAHFQSIAISVDGGAPDLNRHYAIASADSSVATVSASGSVYGVARGLGSVRVRLISGASGADPIDTVLPVHVVIARLRTAKPADTLDAFGDTLKVRPGYLDGVGTALTAAESAAVAPTFALVGPGLALQASPTGVLTAKANGVDIVRISADTARVDLSVVVRQRATRVRGQPDTLRLRAINETRQLADSAFDRRGAVIPGANHTIAWTSANGAVATVSPSGLAAAVGNGSGNLIATVDGAIDTVPVVVAQVAKQVAVATGNNQTGTVGAPLPAPLVAQVADSLGTPAPVPGVPITFRATAGGAKFGLFDTVTVVTDAQGRASATPKLGTVAGNTNTFTATGVGLTGTAAFSAGGGPAAAHHVLLVSGGGQAAGVGTTLPNALVVAVRDSFGNAVPNASVRFLVTAGGGKLSGADSVTLAADVQGNVQATFTLGPLIGSAVNRVAARPVGSGAPPLVITADGLVPVASVVVTPALDTLAVSGTIQLAAVTRDSVGNVLTGRVVVWSSSAPSVATVDATGKATAVAAGDAFIIASSEGRADTAAITVLGPLASVTLSSHAVTLRSGATSQLTATLRDASGHIVSGTITWSSTDNTVAPVSASGLVTAALDGTAKVIATAGSRADTAVITVTAIPVASVNVQPKQLFLYRLGETSQLSVVARDSNGVTIPNARYVWATGGTVVAVSQSGLVTSTQPGSALVWATSGGAADTVAVQVIALALACGSGGTAHTTNISASETWARGLHSVTGALSVTATVTVMPGALVCFSQGASLAFGTGGRLNARGRAPADSQIVFTAANTAQPWNGLSFTGTTADTSRLSNARVEYTASQAAVRVVSGVAILDSALVRQTQADGVSFGSTVLGSTLSRSRVESSALAGGTNAALRLGTNASVASTTVQSSGAAGIIVAGAGVRLDTVRVIGSAGVGLDASAGTLALARGLRVSGGNSYPMRAGIGQAVALAVPVDSLTGNLKDTIEITGGTLASGTVALSPVLPYRFTADVDVNGAGAVLSIPAGVHLAMAAGVDFAFRSGGKLAALGNGANPVVFTRLALSGTWGGLWFQDAATNDTSRITGTRIEFATAPASFNNAFNAAVSSAAPVVLDSVVIRQVAQEAFSLNASRVSRSRLDTTGTVGSWCGGVMGTGVTVESTTVRNANGCGLLVVFGGNALRAVRVLQTTGIGLDIQSAGALTAATGIRVTGGTSFPLRTTLNNLPVLLAGGPLDSLLGGSRDTIDVLPSTIASGAVTLPATMPYRIEGDIDVNGATALLVVSPGAHLAMIGSVDFAFRNGGRLVARGLAASTIQFTKVPNVASWGGMYFLGTPTDSSYVTYALIEYGTAATSFNATTPYAMLQTTGLHALVLDSVRIRQALQEAARLESPGSRLSRSVVDTAGMGGGTWSGLSMTGAVRVESTVLRRACYAGLVMAGAGGRVTDVRIEGATACGTPGSLNPGLHLPGTLAALSNVRVVGGAGYPLTTTLDNLRFVQAGVAADSLVGNVRDTVIVAGGSARILQASVTPVLPWRVDASVTFDSASVLTMQPGAGVAMAPGAALIFKESGRLIARGTPTQPVVFTATVPATGWTGLSFQGRTGIFLGGVPRDTSYLTNARVEFAGQSNGTAIVSAGKHVVLIDSASIRQSLGVALNLNSALSHVWRSTIDSSVGVGATLGDSTFLDSVVIRRAGSTGLAVGGTVITVNDPTVLSPVGIGVSVTGQFNTVRRSVVSQSGGNGIDITQANVLLDGATVTGAQGIGINSPNRLFNALPPFVVSGGASYALRVHPSDYVRFIPDSSARAAFANNARDTILITSGSMLGGAMLVSPVQPVRFESSPVVFDNGAVLTVRPGYVFRMQGGQGFTFQGGARLVARGTAAQQIQFVPDNPASPWGALSFLGTPSDSSYLTNVRLVRGAYSQGSYVVASSATHPVIMDSAAVRQSRFNGVQLAAPGSRFTRSTIDTTGRDNNGVPSNTAVGVALGASTKADSSVIRGTGGDGVQISGNAARLTADSVLRAGNRGVFVSGGTGVQVTGTRILGSAVTGLQATAGSLTALTGTRVTGGAGIPLRAGIEALALLPLDSLLGNGFDAVGIVGGTLSNATVTATPQLLWYLEGNVTVDAGATMVVQPGTPIYNNPLFGWYFQNGGKLVARGTAANPVVFTGNPLAPWEGLNFSGTLAVGDTSYLTNVRLEYAGRNGGVVSAISGSSATHPVVIDSTRIRQIQAAANVTAVSLLGSGSRVSRSVLDTVGTATSSTALLLAGAGAKAESTTVRRPGGDGIRVTANNVLVRADSVLNAGGRGVWVQGGTGVQVTGTKIIGGRGSSSAGIEAVVGSLTSLTGTRVSGGSWVSLWTGIEALALIPRDSLLGNACACGSNGDAVLLKGGTLSNVTLTVTPQLWWYLSGSVTVDAGASVVAQPGVQVAMDPNVGMTFQNGGRLSARGTQPNPVVFTATNPVLGWNGLTFSGTLAAGDTSFLTNVRLEYAGANNQTAINGNSATHPVAIDSARIRQIQAPANITAVSLSGTGSRISRSVLDTVGTATSSTALLLAGAGAKAESTTVRRPGGAGIRVAANGVQLMGDSVLNAGDRGVWVQSGTGVQVAGTKIVGSALTGLEAAVGSLASLVGTRVTGGVGGYPFWAGIEALTLISPDSLIGNVNDYAVLSGGSLAGATLIATPQLPWLAVGSITIDAGGVVVVQPGVRVLTWPNIRWTFQNGGRLSARGTAANPVVFSAGVPTQPWDGFRFANTLAAGDSSFLTNAVIEFAAGPMGIVVNGEGTGHPVVIDSSRLRQLPVGANSFGVVLRGNGSRLSRSALDTVGIAVTSVGAFLAGTSQKIESTRFRRTSGIGISLSTGANGAIVSGSEIINSGSTGIAVTSGLTGIVISGSNIFGNTGAGMTAGTGVSPTITATGNWWGSAVGAPGTNGAIVGNINTASPAAALLVLSIPFP